MYNCDVTKIGALRKKIEAGSASEDEKNEFDFLIKISCLDYDLLESFKKQATNMLEETYR